MNKRWIVVFALLMMLCAGCSQETSDPTEEVVTENSQTVLKEGQLAEENASAAEETGATAGNQKQQDFEKYNVLIPKKHERRENKLGSIKDIWEYENTSDWQLREPSATVGFYDVDGKMLDTYSRTIDFTIDAKQVFERDYPWEDNYASSELLNYEYIYTNLEDGLEYFIKVDLIAQQCEVSEKTW